MNITLSFETYEEMTAFAHKLIPQEQGFTTLDPLPILQEAAPTPITTVQTSPAQNQTPPQQMTATIPATTTTYELDDLARASMTLMDAGRQGDLQQLLVSFGVEMLPALPREQYGAFATGLRGLGAQI